MPAKPVEPDGVRSDPAPARLRARQGLVLHLNRLGLADGTDDRSQRHWIDAPHRRRCGSVGRQVRDPALFALQHIVGNQAELGKVMRCIWRAELAVEAPATDIGARALVVDHVVRRQRDVAVQVRGRLVHRNAELLHHVDAIDVTLPEQAELNELEPLLDPPAKFSLVPVQIALPPSPARTRTVRAQFLGCSHAIEAERCQQSKLYPPRTERVRYSSHFLRHLPSRKRSPDPVEAEFFRYPA